MMNWVMSGRRAGTGGGMVVVEKWNRGSLPDGLGFLPLNLSHLLGSGLGLCASG
jgi:hypothetical protein